MRTGTSIQRAALLGLICLAGLGGGRLVAADELAGREWTLVTSQNFSVHSVLPVERTIELLRHLEIMRTAFDDPGAAPTYQSGVPTTIVCAGQR